ncbi:MAG: SUMF1/EgtB/PvdO family nonheme iron enzyme [Anaerolineae bacterium]|nr:SUMF1/EgtB/PvdO family nonheme iron enzyme [Anaerolineae bacterium]MBL8105376.1 SUMF1/EgtB/PvdO family nonheme iron enzyme [Anaerolineales bacterium]MCC7190877.1 SUMF1/EgtB/PvdO family nonheme iron enzyme [Anaerolineales bacterium]
MKKLNSIVSIFFIGAFLMSACNLGAMPQATSEPGSAIQPPVGTEPPVLTEVPIQPTQPQTITQAPVDLSGPPMEVGSKFLYVDGSTLVAVPGGPFTMGHGGDDNPEHEVNVSDFWLYRSKVTNSQYALCVLLGKCSPPNVDKNGGYGDPVRANHPVTGVNYQQASEYCSFVNGRLPTEAEWEKAARGPDGNIYPWGDATPQCDLVNYGTCEYETSKVIDHPAGQSYYEAFDMAGNVYEWVADWYDANYYNNSPLDDPLGPDLALRRSVRSSGFNSPAYESESARRLSLAPVEQRNDLGFRCVVEDPMYFAPMCAAALVYGQDAAPGSPGGGGAPSETCPTVAIQVVPICVNQAGSANVSFTGPPGAAVDAGTCSPTGNPGQYSCLSPTTISIKADCQQSLPGSPACPLGFQQQGNQCVSQGWPGQCLPGYNYDPNSQCCSAQPGQDGSVPLPQCPVGTYYLPGQNVCVPYPAQGVVSVVQNVGIPNCIIPTRKPGGGGDIPDVPTVCAPPTDNCGNFLWCEKLCACVRSSTQCPP